jgi:hypothetical protein
MTFAARFRRSVMESHLPQRDRLLRLALCEHANEIGVVKISLDALQHRLGGSKRTIQKMMRRARGDGIFYHVETGRGRAPNEYQLRILEPVLRPKPVPNARCRTTWSHKQQYTAGSRQPVTDWEDVFDRSWSQDF